MKDIVNNVSTTDVAVRVRKHYPALFKHYIFILKVTEISCLNVNYSREFLALKRKCKGHNLLSMSGP